MMNDDNNIDTNNKQTTTMRKKKIVFCDNRLMKNTMTHFDQEI